MDSKSDSSEEPHFVSLPETHSDLTQMAERALREAGTYGELPTDLDRVLEVSDVSLVEDSDELRQDFLSSFTGRVKATAENALSKLKGIADLRERAVWVARSDRPQGIVFPKAHEASHHIIPWHSYTPGYKDSAETLSPEVEAEFEREANFMAGELIFQGDSFRKKALSYEASFEAVFTLAENHLATYQSTIWRYVEVQDEMIAVAMYYPKLHDPQRRPKTFTLWTVIPSESFRKRCGGVELPRMIGRTESPWTRALSDQGICKGNCKLPCDGTERRFMWESWWNRYTLFVLIRARPTFSFVGDIARKISRR